MVDAVVNASTYIGVGLIFIGLSRLYSAIYEHSKKYKRMKSKNSELKKMLREYEHRVKEAEQSAARVNRVKSENNFQYNARMDALEGRVRELGIRNRELEVVLDNYRKEIARRKKQEV